MDADLTVDRVKYIKNVCNIDDKDMYILNNTLNIYKDYNIIFTTKHEYNTEIIKSIRNNE